MDNFKRLMNVLECLDDLQYLKLVIHFDRFDDEQNKKIKEMLMKKIYKTEEDVVIDRIEDKGKIEERGLMIAIDTIQTGNSMNKISQRKINCHLLDERSIKNQ